MTGCSPVSETTARDTGLTHPASCQVLRHCLTRSLSVSDAIIPGMLLQKKHRHPGRAEGFRRERGRRAGEWLASGQVEIKKGPEEKKLNQTTKDWHTGAVTLNKVKGLAVRFFAPLRMTTKNGHIVKCTKVLWFYLGTKGKPPDPSPHLQDVAVRTRLPDAPRLGSALAAPLLSRPPAA